ncbi:MAG: chorismate mutase [Chloroflexi bacterium]|nr:chorismate mutase [Chloroflexota bacterium]
MKVRGVRGATTADANDRESVMSATGDLLRTMITQNGIESDDLAAVQFTTSPDLVAEFPAVAAREQLGWKHVPLLNAVEIDRPGAQPLCIRILMFWNTDRAQNEIKHVYLKGAVNLRADLASAQ